MREVERVVRRARLRLDAVRLAKSAARGALAASAVALAFFRGGPWPVVGALAGLVASLVRPRVPLAAAALFLDDRWGTKERVATLLTRPDTPFAARLAGEIELARRLPRVPFPREAAAVPAALLLVFAAGLLPDARADGGKRGTAMPSEAASEGRSLPPPEDAPRPDEDARRRIAHGELPEEPEARRDLREALERHLRRPEDRRAARAKLARAEEGDAQAARDLGRMLDEALGDREREDPAADGGKPSGAPGPPSDGAGASADAAGVVRTAAVYPDEAGFLREYRRARAEEDEEK